MPRSLLSLIISCCCISHVDSVIFDLEEARKHLWLSAAAYCGAEKISSHDFHGPTAGFIVTHAYVDNDTEGFVGYLPSDSSIYVVFRGSSTIESWILDLHVTLTSYDGSCCGLYCEIHRGFYREARKAFPGILSAVQSLQSLYPASAVKCTGHSLGGALAQITAMGLRDEGILPALLYTFGQPRIGNKNYATCSSSSIPTMRVTHRKDLVPHLPFQLWGYHQECREAYESSSSLSDPPEVRDCDPSHCEDSECSNRWSYLDLNVDDHLTYLGLSLSCSAVSKKQEENQLQQHHLESELVIG